MNQENLCYYCIAVAVPLRQLFTYHHSGELNIGIRVEVPFGRRQLVGVVIAQSSKPNFKTKALLRPLDEVPLLSQAVLDIVTWASLYYHHPIGEVCALALPTYLRKNNSADDPEREIHYSIEATDKVVDLSKAPKQLAVFEAIKCHGHPISHKQLKHALTNAGPSINALLEKKLISSSLKLPTKTTFRVTPHLVLSEDQQRVADNIHLNDGFSATCIHGITGSGKTEVYFELIDRACKGDGQALVLVPEISLTTQLLDRFRKRYGEQVTSIHSGLSSTKRYKSWWRIKHGHSRVLLGTRSSVFSDFHCLRLIVIDEEHDSSYKQSDTCRYHARQVASKRAQNEGIAIIYGSATPSLETAQLKSHKHFQWLTLNARFGAAVLPTVQLINTKQYPTTDGLSGPLIQAVQNRLERNEQSILFINRRGYSPVYYCADCEWKAMCLRCDSAQTLHKNRLHCHHCGQTQVRTKQCPSCSNSNLISLGEGTQRIEERISTLFPEANVQRFDRDHLNTQSKLTEALHAVSSLQTDVLIGTQLLSKGHDFPNITLVGVINTDNSLFSTDFRATEHLLQQLLQVSGRAGRADKEGTVFIQTEWPDHPIYQHLINHDYSGFIDSELAQRKAVELPPYNHLAMWRSDAPDEISAYDTLGRIADIGKQLLNLAVTSSSLIIYDVTPSTQPKRAGRYRFQLLVQAKSRVELHQLLAQWVTLTAQSRTAPKARWSLDIDPLDMY